MKKYFLATLLSLISVSVMAADIPLKKVNPLFTGYPYDSSGFYWGVNTMATADSSSVSGAPGTTGTMFAAGAALGGTIGYQWGRGTTFYAIEAMVNYTNLGATAPIPAGGTGSINSKFGFEQRVKFGGPLAAMLSVLPEGGLKFPGLPTFSGGANATSAATHPYIMAGIREDEVTANLLGASSKAWRVRASVGAGIMQQLTNGIVADTWIEYNPASTGLIIGGPGGSANMGHGYRIGASLLY